MSENKKVIRVKDLVIEADNVIIESKRQHRPDPFFGGFGRRRQGVEEGHMESSSSSVLGDESDNRKDEDDRRPFSWI